MNHLLENWYARFTMRILLLDGHFCRNITRDLIEFIVFLNDFTPKARPKCLIILANGNSNSSFLNFFKFAWENTFLDITVIEFVEINKIKSLNVLRNINDKHNNTSVQSI